MKRNAMAQVMNLHWNNIFVYWTRLPLLCEKSGAILLALMGLIAGRQQAGRQSDKILIDLKFLKFSTYRIGWIFTAFSESTILL